MRVFHYTIGYKMPSIVESRHIRLSMCGLDRVTYSGMPVNQYVNADVTVRRDNAKPAVWCTVSEVWEELASKVGAHGKAYTRKEIAKYCEGCYRIEVVPEAAPYTWKEWKAMSGAKREIVQEMEMRARQVKSRPVDWRVGFEPIPDSKWIGFERFNEEIGLWEVAHPPFTTRWTVCGKVAMRPVDDDELPF